MYNSEMGSGSATSSRSPFRSQSGCCICGTKSSSSRFTSSVRYSEHFVGCFGPQATNRTGDFCNACVLCVKRWLQRTRQPGLFSQVVDSKKGPGPKHMKEITKRARRREARRMANLCESCATSSKVSGNPVTCSHKSITSTHSNSSTLMRSSATSVNGSMYRSSPWSNSTRSTFTKYTSCSVTTTVERHHVNGSTVSPPAHRVHSDVISAPASTLGSLEHSIPDKTTPTGGRHSKLVRHQQLHTHFCSPHPIGATFTRSAAAAIRKSEAANQSLGTLTPSCCCDCCKDVNITNPSTPSESSDYGSGVLHGCFSCCCHCSPASSPCSHHCSTKNDEFCCNGSTHSCPNGGLERVPRSPPCCAFCYSPTVPCKRARHGSLETTCLCRGCPCVGHRSLCHASHISHSTSACVTRSQTSATMSGGCCMSEFRHPQAPPLSTPLSTSSTSSLPGSSPVSEPGQTITTPSTRRYNRRVVLPPVRMTDNAEVNSLLREIMERNSQALNFDSRELHMAVQKELRLRSRTVQKVSSSTASDSVSGRASSVSSTDGSVDTVCNSNRIASTPSSLSNADKCVCNCLATRQHCVRHCCASHHTRCLHEHIHLRHLACVHPSCTGSTTQTPGVTRKS